MGYGIYRIEKRTKNTVGGIKKENNRTKEEKEAWEKEHPGKTYLPNSDIEWDKTKDNIYLKKDDNWYKAIQEEIDKLELKKAPRKDAIVLLDHFVGISPEEADKMDEKALISYFEDAYEYIKKEYGHVVNAVIHLDEKTPHMHVVTVPITQDGRLSAKTLTSGSMSFRQVQDRFYKEVSKKYGLKRGEPKAETNREHLEKRQWMAQQLDKEIEEQRDTYKKEYFSLINEKADIQDKVAELQYQEAKLNNSIKKKALTLEATENSIKMASTDLQMLRSDIQDLKSDKKALETQISDLKGQAGSLVESVIRNIAEFFKMALKGKYEAAAQHILNTEIETHAAVDIMLPTEGKKLKEGISKTLDEAENTVENIQPEYIRHRRRGR